MPQAPAGRSIQDASGHDIVAVTNKVCLDTELIADHSLDRVWAAIHRGSDIFDEYARAARRHGLRRQGNARHVLGFARHRSYFKKRWTRHALMRQLNHRLRTAEARASRRTRRVSAHRALLNGTTEMTCAGSPEMFADGRAERAFVHDTLRRLGVRRFVLGVHDSAFPPGAWDAGYGAPVSQAGRQFLAFASRLGFNALQLGPTGQISTINLSPYDGTAFAPTSGHSGWAPLRGTNTRGYCNPTWSIDSRSVTGARHAFSPSEWSA